MGVDFANPSPQLPLNDLQRLFVLWEEHQLFSAIDAVEVFGAVDLGLLRTSAEQELARVGIGFPRLSADGRRVTYLPETPAVRVELVLPESAPPTRALADQFSKELNRPFQRNLDPIIRLWVLQTLPNPHIGMTWQHWPMDGASAGDLFRNILARYAQSPLIHERGATCLVTADQTRPYRSFMTWKRKIADLIEFPREMFRTSRVFPVPRPRPNAALLKVHLMDLTHPARPPGATINDVLIAALLSALADLFPERRHNSWRRRINLMSIIDLRPYTSETLQKAWGMFLGFCIFHLPEPRPACFSDMVASVCAQSLRLRRDNLFLSSPDSYRPMRLLLPLLPKRLRWTLPYRAGPFTAGLTNTRFRGDWSNEPLRTRFGRSWRVASLGNHVPIAVDACSKGDQLSLALTCESPSVMNDRIEAIQVKIRDLLCRY